MEKDLLIDDKNAKMQKVTDKLTALKTSNVFLHARAPRMRRILPSFLDNEHLRVRTDRFKIGTRTVGKEFEFLDEMYEQASESLKAM